MSSVPVLAVRTRRRACAVPLEHVAEVMRPLPVKPLAGAPAYVFGLAIIRGNATPVIDLDALLDDGASTDRAQPASRFVTLRVGDRAIALLVDSVEAIRALPSGDLTVLPPLWQGSRPPAVTALGTLDRELLVVLETTRLLTTDWAVPPVEAMP